MEAKRDYIDTLAARENVTFVWDSEITDVLGEHGVTGVRVRHVKNGTTSDIKCAGLFPFVGVVPNTGFVPKTLLTETGQVRTDQAFATADPRVFAVGAARAEYGGNVVQAMAEGISAADA
jgi:thioredoxin reductase (NADPH)